MNSTLKNMLFWVVLIVVGQTTGYISDRIGRRKALVFVSTALFAVGLVMLTQVHTVSGFYIVEAVLGAAYGATVTRAPELLHGKTSLVNHTGAGVLAGLPDPFIATRYHSLTILPDTVPADLEVTARTEGGVIMGVRHTELPIHGVQFHPESIASEHGHRILGNFLAATKAPA